MSTQATLPELPQTFDAEEFRRRLVGLTDPDYSPALDDNKATVEHKAAATELVLCLCDLFGKSLDRITLWDKIPAAMAAAVSKCDDGDTDRLISLCFEGVNTDHSAVARNTQAAGLIYDLSTKPMPWRQGFVRYLATRSFAVVMHGRLAWERVKSARADERAMASGGTLSTGELVERGGEQ